MGLCKLDNVGTRSHVHPSQHCSLCLYVMCVVQSDDPCPDACDLLRIPGFSWYMGIQYDAMHVISGIVKDTVLGTLTERRVSADARTNEEQLGRPLPVLPGKVSSIRIEFEAALARVRMQLSTSSDEYRFARILDPSKKVKAQTWCCAAHTVCTP